MLLVISPSKTQNFQCRDYPDYSIPVQLEQSRQLISVLKKMTAEELGELMKISDKLSQLNRQRFTKFRPPFDLQNARQALLAFKGDVYNGIDADNYTDEDFAFAQNHLRILSGLYGVLKPLDLIQPYRLEMCTKLATEHGKNLYEFWGEKVTKALNQDIEKQENPLLVNLASIEYFKVIKTKLLKAPVLTISFKEKKNGQYKVIALYAKRARGLMADFVIQKKITDINQLQNFDREGYQFNEALSNRKEWVFCRG